MTSSGWNSASRGQDAALEGVAKFCGAVAGAQRRVDDGIVLAALDHRASAGEQRHLVRRAIHHRLVRPENLLRAVAVMHVEIDDGGARNAVMILRVARGDRGIVEKAKAHRPRGLGVMAGRTRRDKGVGGFFPHHFVDGADGGRRPRAGAASKLPGDIEVSASSRNHPLFR